MDAATKPTWTYLRRPSQPDPPSHPTESQLLKLTLPWLEAGAGLQALPEPLPRRGSSTNPSQPTLPATDSSPRHPGKDQENQNQKPILRTSITSAVPTNGRHPPEQNAVPTDRRKLSKAGWVRLRGCERHGCRDQAPHGRVHGVPCAAYPPGHGQFPAPPRERSGKSKSKADPSDVHDVCRADQRSAPTKSSGRQQTTENCRRRGGSG